MKGQGVQSRNGNSENHIDQTAPRPSPDITWYQINSQAPDSVRRTIVLSFQGLSSVQPISQSGRRPAFFSSGPTRVLELTRSMTNRWFSFASRAFISSHSTTIYIRSIGTSSHTYSLREPTRLVYNDSRLAFAGIIGFGASVEAARIDLGIRFHKEFQRLRNIPPTMRSPIDEARWRHLIQLIDINEYNLRNPVDEPVYALIERIDGTTVTIWLITEEEHYQASLDELPDVAAALMAGDYFEARIRRFPGRFQWISVSKCLALRDDPDVASYLSDPPEQERVSE